ncbi:hypothetical protein NQ318_009062 [Aromia moschata]|uniref:SH3 domain-containing protein n=1 Tax=Aromia moschata TaxID=1265417 RepID=A0AAV8YUG9_9CUCU|nr:hypothetical protein NQ318_009062 [Aromia moschata]
MCSFKSIYFVIFVLNLYKTNAQISDKRLCVDADCKEPVSLAKTLLRYSSPDPRLLSFAPNEQITIYSKEAGSQSNLWGAEIRGKRGYVPKNLVREYKVFKKPQLLVDTELKHKSQVPLANKEKVDPDAVQKAFEVVDGTTIYINPQDSINPSSTESPIQPTAVPPGSKTTEGEAEASKKPVDESQDESSLKETIPESVVNNVLSTISNYWMKDDTKETDGSAEGEDPEEDDDFEDDEDEDEDEEDSIEENDLTDAEKQNEAKNESALQKSQDPDLLHNLPLGVTLSTYSLEEGPISSKESGVSKEIPPQQEIISNDAVINPASIPVTTELKGPGNIEAKTDSNLKSPPPISTVPSLNILDPLVFEKTVVPEEKLGIEASKENESPEPKVITELPSSSVLPDTTTEDPKDNIVDAPDILPEITTVPTPFDEEQVPYVDEVTPNPLNTKTEEVSPEQDEKINEDQAMPAQQQAEENQSQNVGSTSDHLQNNSVLPFKEEPITTDEMKSAEVVEEGGTHVVKDQEVPAELPSPPLLGGFYNPVQNMLNPNIVEEKQQFPSENLNDPAKDTGGSKEENEASKESQIFTEAVATQSSVEASDAEQKENLIISIESDTSKEEPTSSEVVKVSDRVEEQSTENLDDVTVTGNNNLEDSREGNSMVQNTDQDTQNKDVYYEDSKEYNSEVKNEESNTPNEESNNNEGPKEDSTEVTNVEEVAPNKETVNYGDSSTEAEGGIFSNILSWFGSSSEEPESSSTLPSDEGSSKPEEVDGENLWPTHRQESVIEYCDASIETCNTSEKKDLTSRNTLLEDIELSFNSDIFVYLLTTSISVIVFLFGYMLLDRSRRESPLIVRINKLEKELLVTMKEKELLEEKGPTLVVPETGSVPNEVLEEMTQRLADVQLANSALELKVQELTVELEGKQASRGTGGEFGKGTGNLHGGRNGVEQNHFRNARSQRRQREA